VADASGEHRIMAAVRAVDWVFFDHAKADQVLRAFERVLRARSQSEAQLAYTAVLDAVAQNQFGWLRDAAAPAAPLLAQVVAETDEWPRWAATEVLITLLSWARPNHEFVDQHGLVVQVADVVRAAVGGIHGTLEAVASGGSDVPTASSARELLDAFTASR
jgi:hypothetical protein